MFCHKGLDVANCERELAGDGDQRLTGVARRVRVDPDLLERAVHMVNGGETERSVLTLLRVILEHPEAEPCERRRDVVRRTGDGVDEAVGVVEDVIRESVGVREHHRILHHFRVLAVKRADCRNLRRREIVPRRPENFHVILHFRARGLWP